MNQLSPQINRIIRITLSGICVGLVLLLWYELTTQGSNYIERDQADGSTIDKKNRRSNAGSNYPDISVFNEMIQRPLFNKTRLPFVVPESPQTVVKPKNTKKQEQLSLSAVVITPETQMAIIEKGKKKSLHRVSLGESIDGWVVESIKPHSIDIKKGNVRKILELEIKSSTAMKAVNKRTPGLKQKKDKTNEGKSTKTAPMNMGQTSAPFTRR